MALQKGKEMWCSLEKKRASDTIRFGKIIDSNYTQRLKCENEWIIETIRMQRKGPFWLIKQFLRI